MSVIVNQVRSGLYLDSVALMRLSREIAALDGIEEAGLMMGTPANKDILRDAKTLDATGESAAAGDLVLAVRAATRAAADFALATANTRLDQPKQSAVDASTWRPRSLRAAVASAPDASLALISTPGDYAASEARKALALGLNVMIFSDNVPLDEEVALKQEAREKGLLVMGPDCGTAIIAGAPLAFANKVPRGRIGIVGASGTGIQEVSCLIARLGDGVSHAIGVGGRDLKAEVGGLSTLQAIDLLDEDDDTDHIVLISKPPAASVVEKIATRIGESRKSFTVCFIGATHVPLHGDARLATTLKSAAELATGKRLQTRAASLADGVARGKSVRGLYSGGTLCAEAQVLFRDAGVAACSNVPIPGVRRATPQDHGHVLIDLGDDEFTRGRPHPMIEPSVRDQPLREALADPSVGVILIDIVLGFGGHIDPAGHLAALLKDRVEKGPLVIGSVTGVEDDPQPLSAQTRKLEEAGVIVAPSNADAVALALRAVTS
ncbi:MAG: oxidoreductase [Rhizobiales bacterium 65-9]|nr:acyl-CoA synthetase FdrA [Hyphomicrobiales bacterium]OJY34072.1 MAG: oxidoreductase [Rhizobiales bacterium 65-9]